MTNPDTRESITCPFCDSTAHHNGRSFDCEACDTRWSARNLSVSRQLEEWTDRRTKEKRAYRRAKAREPDSWLMRIVGWFR